MTPEASFIQGTNIKKFRKKLLTSRHRCAILCKVICFTAPEVTHTEKNLSYGVLLDCYGALLTERQRDVLGLYYNDDLSLSEISENTGISRQGVRDAIKHGEAELDRLEGALHIAQSIAEKRSDADLICAELDRASTLADNENVRIILEGAARRVRSLSEK